MVNVKNNIERLRRKSTGMPRMKDAAASLMLAIYASVAVMTSYSRSAFVCIIGAAVASAVLAAVAFAYRRPWILAVPVISSAAVFILTYSAAYTVMSLLPIPTAAAVVAAFALKRKKSGIVAAASVAVGAWLILTLLASALSGDIKLSYDWFTETLKSSLMSMTVRTADGPAPMFTEALADGLVEYITLSLPAILTVCSMAAAYIASSLFPRLLCMMSFEQYVYGGALTYTPTAAAGVVYLLAVTVSASLAVDASYDMIGFAAENLLLILMPAMLIYGIRVLKRYAVKHDKRFLFVVLAFILLFSLPSLLLMAVTFTGAIHIIYIKLRPKMKKLMDRMRSDDEDIDDFDSERFNVNYDERGDDDEDYNDDDDDDDSDGGDDNGGEPKQNDYGDRFR